MENSRLKTEKTVWPKAMPFFFGKEAEFAGHRAGWLAGSLGFPRAARGEGGMGSTGRG